MVHLRADQAIDVRTKRPVTIVRPKFVYSVHKTASGKLRKMYRLVGTGGSPGGKGRVSKIVSADLKGFGKPVKVTIKRKPAAKRAVAKKPAAKRAVAKKPAAKKKVTKKCVVARDRLKVARSRVVKDVKLRKKACAPRKSKK